jgi:hypothetical protein
MEHAGWTMKVPICRMCHGLSATALGWRRVSERFNPETSFRCRLAAGAAVKIISAQGMVVVRASRERYIHPPIRYGEELIPRIRQLVADWDAANVKILANRLGSSEAYSTIVVNQRSRDRRGLLRRRPEGEMMERAAAAVTFASTRGATNGL